MLWASGLPDLQIVKNVVGRKPTSLDPFLKDQKAQPAPPPRVQSLQTGEHAPKGMAGPQPVPPPSQNAGGCLARLHYGTTLPGLLGEEARS